MSAQTDLDTGSRLATLRRSYGASLREKIGRLEQMANDFHLGDEEKTRTSLEGARALSHRMAGSAATFGYGQVGVVARTLEHHLAKTIAAQDPPCESDIDEFKDLLRAIASEEKQASMVDVRSVARGPSQTKSNPSAIARSAPIRRHRLFISHGGYFAGRDLLLAFENCGFEVHVCDEGGSAVSQAEDFRPDVVIIVLDQGEISGFELAENLWCRTAFQGVEIFFFVRSQEFRRRVLLNGISDEWIISSPIDNDELACRILRRMFDVKAGRAQSSRPYMMPYLTMFKSLAIPGNKARVADVVRKKVLLVDDDQELVEATSNVLSDRGIEVFRACSGFQGLQLALNERPDLIITDFEMPNGTAEYLIAELGKSEAIRPGVILMTAANVVEKYRLDINNAFNVNVLDYFQKPLDLVRLVTEVERHLEAESRTRHTELCNPLARDRR